MARVAPAVALNKRGHAQINRILREWLEYSGDPKLELVGPGRRRPHLCGHVARQVILKDELAMDYLEEDALKFLSKRERLFR
jgi:hypothetical protein